MKHHAAHSLHEAADMQRHFLKQLPACFNVYHRVCACIKLNARCFSAPQAFGFTLQTPHTANLRQLGEAAAGTELEALTARK